ncbi:hypothetical protein F5Y16DRAFT_398790 [Xylariaceae sp. FL0255]|nr:hypothetical protein F5Y16DRAFT_398790 [Xylariaceae sp. FL0255]
MNPNAKASTSVSVTESFRNCYAGRIWDKSDWALGGPCSNAFAPNENLEQYLVNLNKVDQREYDTTTITSRGQGESASISGNWNIPITETETANPIVMSSNDLPVRQALDCERTGSARRMCQSAEEGSHDRPLFRLPTSVRRQIYKLAGVRTGKVRRVCKGIYNRNELTLLRVCRAIRDEVEALIVSRNAIFVGSSRPCGLDFKVLRTELEYLGKLSKSTACSNIKDLRVILRFFSDAFWISEQLRDSVLELWQDVMTRILAQADGELKLHLVFDFDTNDPKRKYEMDEALRPLRNHPGALKQLGLRLGSSYSPALSDLAREIALIVERPKERPCQNPFRFMDLPFELRQHVFSYTNLVTPFKKVQWSALDGFNTPFPRCSCDFDTICDKNLHHGRQFEQCGLSLGIESDLFCTQ